MKKFLSSFMLLFLAFDALAMEQDTFEYLLLNAESKHKILSENIFKSRYSSLPPLTGPGLEGFIDLMSENEVARVFLHTGDTLNGDHKKWIHTSGTVVSVAFVADSKHNFTGVFASGAPHGFLRLSMAIPPSKEGWFTSANAKPGFGLKLLIDSEPSVNMLAMYSLDGQSENSPFAHAFTNILAQPAFSLSLAPLECSFKRGLKVAGQENGNPRQLTSTHMASICADGQSVSAPHAPYGLIFKPTPEAQALFDDTTMEDDFRTVLEDRGEGLKLYEVYGYESPSSTVLYLVGSLHATGNFMASSAGDELFFQHPPVHELDNL